MLLGFPALARFMGLAVAVAVPAAVVACTSEVTQVGEEAPAPTTSSTEGNEPTPTPTSTGTTPAAPKDAGADTATPKDAGPPPTDVEGSAECTAYCAKMKSQCNKTCDPKYDCAIPKGQCAASTQKLLACKTTTGQWYCGGDGFSIVHSCKSDTSLCP